MTEKTTKQSLAVFEPLKAELATLEKENANLVFDYQTAKGESDARSHVFKLRRTKGKIAEIHKTAKAEALAHCQAVDSEKNLCLATVEKMIAVHMDPIDAKIKRRKDVEAAAAEKLRKEKEAEEERKRVDLAEREAKVKADEERLAKEEAEHQAKVEAEKKILKIRFVAREAEIAKAEAGRQTKVKVEEEQLAKIATDLRAKIAADIKRLAGERAAYDAKIAKAEAERQAKIAADAKIETERLAKIAEANEKIRQQEAAKIKAAADKLDADRVKFDAEKRAEADAKLRERRAAFLEVQRVKYQSEKKESERLAAIKAEEDEKKRLADEEAKRVADQQHRAKIEREAVGGIVAITKSEELAAKISAAIRNGKIPHVKIIY